MSWVTMAASSASVLSGFLCDMGILRHILVGLFRGLKARGLGEVVRVPQV